MAYENIQFGDVDPRFKTPGGREGQTPATLFPVQATPVTNATNPTSQPGDAMDNYLRYLEGNKRPQAWADVGKSIESFASDQQANRMSEAELQQAYDHLMLQSQADRRAGDTDALKKLQQTAYIRGGGADLSPTSISIRGQAADLPTFGFGPRASTSEEIEGATSLQDESLKRLAGEGYYTPRPVSEYSKPGAMENISRYAGLGTAGIGLLDTLLENKGGIGGLLSKIPGIGGLFGGGGGAAGGISAGVGTSNVPFGGAAPGGAGSGIGRFLGQAAPYAGLAAGTYGLIKNKGLASNVGSGALAGASLGSIVPGLGTLVGGGIGAGVGAARSLIDKLGGGASEEEQAGRQAQAQVQQMIVQGATPQQQQEAQAAGWDNPQDALALIVLRDKLIETGGTPEQANQLMAQLNSATKGGPQAVEQAVMQIQQALQPGVARA